MKKIKFKERNFLADISKKRFVLGLVLGLVFSFSFYSFLIVLREVVGITFTSIPTRFEKNELFFYNYVYAIFTSILGFSIMLKVIFETPRPFLGNKYFYRKKISILNDLSVLNASFLSVLFRLAILLGVFFGSVYSYYFSIYAEFRYLIYLILIVLFLEQWKTLRLVFGNKAFKWMLITFVGILSYSFILSKLSVIDHNKIYEFYIKNTPLYNYQIELPGVYNYKIIRKNSLAPELTIAYKKHDIDFNDLPCIISENNIEYSLETLPNLINQIIKTHSEAEIPLLTFKLNTHRDVKMSQLLKIKKVLGDMGISKIGYAVEDKGSDMPKELFFGYVADEKIKSVQSKNFPPPPPPPDILMIPKEHLYHIKLMENGRYSINGKIEKLNVGSFEKYILVNPKQNFFYLEFTKNTTLNDYLSAKDLIISAYKKIRNDYTLKGYNKPLDDLSSKQIRYIKQKFPQLITVKD